MPGIPTLRTAARSKINLFLLLGPLRDDGYHEVATVIVPVDLADTVTVEASDGDVDEVICPGVEGDNLAAKAVMFYRERSGWNGPPIRMTIDKQVPVAAGMGGGSGDAAAALRLVAAASGDPNSRLLPQIAPLLGADVPAMLNGTPVLATGIGEQLEPLPAPADSALLVLPARVGLSTPEVFAKAGELGLRRPAGDLSSAVDLVRGVTAKPGWELPVGLLGCNDLGTAALGLSDEVAEAVDMARLARADHVFVTGSGPTVIGMFSGAGCVERRDRAAGLLAARVPEVIRCAPSFGSATIEEVA